jgi:glutathione S-transferase
MKADGKLAFGQLPALEVEDGRIICQSAAILRFVGRYAGLYPNDDFVAAAIIDSLMDEEIDLFTGLSVTRYKG